MVLHESIAYKTTFVVAFLISVSIFVFISPPARALSGSDFSAGMIIDDSTFYKPGAMNPDQIQLFLNSKVPACDTNGNQIFSGSTTRAQYGTSKGYPPPYTCLKDYSQNVSTVINSGSDLCQGSITAGSKSAAQIIYEVSQACGINPQVLIVLLQKEQSLVTDDWPWSIQYRSATGYGCPDTAPCDSEFYGFFNQVYQAAKAYKRYQSNQSNYNYRAGRNNNILFNPNTACGSSQVYIHSQATAGLYIYTPYQPNAAALNNLYGSGDSCSAYGNRNFWRIFSDWFGSPISMPSGRLNITQYNSITDASGGAVWLGFSLNKKPTAPVYVSFRFSANAPAGFASQPYVTITPENWNKPDRNKVVVYGKDSGVSGMTYYTFMTDGTQTSDPDFKFNSQQTPDISLANWASDANVYRLYSPSINKHIYTSSNNERNSLLANGYSNEGIAFSLCEGGEKTVYRLKNGEKTVLLPSGSSEIQSALAAGFSMDIPAFNSSRGASVPVYRMYNSTTDDHLFTQTISEYNSAVAGGYIKEGVAFYVCSPGQKPVYRLYSAASGDHFYTASSQERDSAGGAGYTHEGVSFYLCPSSPTINVYRLYSAASGDHFYTASSQEINSAKNGGYKNEGVAFKLCSTTNLPVYRAYSANMGNHFYTQSSSELQSAIKSGYKSEGVGFYTSP